MLKIPQSCSLCTHSPTRFQSFHSIRIHFGVAYIFYVYIMCVVITFLGKIFPPSSQIMEYHLCVAIVTIIYESKPKLFESEQNQLQLYGTCIDVLFSRRYKGTYVAQILLLMRIHNLCLCDFFSSFAHFKLVTLGIKKISSLVF